MRATPAALAGLAGLDRGHRRRRGKFLLLPFERGGSRAQVLAANPMLAGRFWLLDDGRERVRARTGLRLRFTDGTELRYVDREMLGKLYLVEPEGLDAIPGWARWGPMPTTRPSRSRSSGVGSGAIPGQLKPLLRNSRFVAGIGNAYSDEILWEARLAPFRRRSTLHRRMIDRLYEAMRSVLAHGDGTAAHPRATPYRDPAPRIPQGAPARRRAMSALRP